VWPSTIIPRSHFSLVEACHRERAHRPGVFDTDLRELHSESEAMMRLGSENKEVGTTVQGASSSPLWWQLFRGCKAGRPAYCRSFE
jgi:hypothetical protein